ncbi:uncharacterized protein [Musca autumnalis]|uniref:uncharacterized protein n=1 Tax=Musca autumnalis TaxID=221902 RepID=UPI003CF24B73
MSSTYFVNSRGFTVKFLIVSSRKFLITMSATTGEIGEPIAIPFHVHTPSRILGAFMYRGNGICKDNLLKFVQNDPKNINFERYWEINKEIRIATRIAKNEQLKRKCEEIEALQTLHDDFNMHKKLKETAGIYKRKPPSILFDDNNQAVFEISQRKQIWKEYILKLFTDHERSDCDRNENSDINENSLVSVNPITKEEVIYAVKSLKDKKAVGPDEIPAEMLKLIDENNIQLCEAAMGETQFGFKEGMGTREALVGVQVLIQKCRDVQKDVFMCFVDYEKAFDTVKHDKLMEILTSIGIENNDIRCIKNLYWNQTASVEVSGETTDEVPLKQLMKTRSQVVANTRAKRMQSKSLISNKPETSA